MHTMPNKNTDALCFYVFVYSSINHNPHGCAVFFSLSRLFFFSISAWLRCVLFTLSSTLFLFSTPTAKTIRHMLQGGRKNPMLRLVCLLCVWAATVGGNLGVLTPGEVHTVTLHRKKLPAQQQKHHHHHQPAVRKMLPASTPPFIPQMLGDVTNHVSEGRHFWNNFKFELHSYLT